MGCSSCGVRSKTKDGKPAGCQSNGGCSTGGCNRLNVYDWLVDLPYGAQQDAFKVIEVSFKNGSRKGFYRNINNIDCHTGDMVAVEATTGGYDIGKISLSGELVRLQMKKRNVPIDADLPRVMRVTTYRDMERFDVAKSKEYETMLMARVIARNLDLQMKIGDVEYQGDGRKATFYYTADDRVDFRELIKLLAKEFRVKIEMRQIGSRQEASRIGGIGSCGRELCCSTWLTKFKSVSTTAARYQNLAINQSKLSGQCGRLKCCLNYELNMYMEALKGFPRNADFIETKQGKARLIKTDIFKRKMWYSMLEAHAVHALSVDRVNEILEMNAKGETPETLVSISTESSNFITKIGFEDGVGEIDLDTLGPLEKSRRRRRNRKRNKGKSKGNNSNENQRKSSNTPSNSSKTAKTTKPKSNNHTKSSNQNKRNRNNRNNNSSSNTTAKKSLVNNSGSSNPQKPISNQNKNQEQNPTNKEGTPKKRNSRNRRNNRPKKE